VPASDVKFKPGQDIELGTKIRIPLDENSNAIINYAGKWGEYYKHYSYVDVIQSFASAKANEQGAIDLNVFKNKICLIGLTATGTTDLHPNPFASLYPALAVHADFINSILNHKFISRASKTVNLLILLLLAVLISWAVFSAKPFISFLVLVALIMSYGALSMLLFASLGIWVDLFYPLFALLVVYLLCALVLAVREWKKRLLIENELSIARRIQESFLPKSVPIMKGLDVAAVMDMAKEVGGDLYDFYEFTPHKLGVAIGDVSGKGIPASLFMTTVCGAFRFFALPNTSAEKALFQLNAKLIQESSSHLFVTMFYAIFDSDQKAMTYSNGGHLPLLYLPYGSSVQFLDVEEGYPLGMLESSYSAGKVDYSTGDIFVFYTDGIIEARNSKERMYGKERLVYIVENNREVSARNICSAIEEDVKQFEPKGRQFDDMTLVVIKVL
jgi:adenylate cyclase